MATTAKIAKDVKLEKARKAKTPKLQCRHRNRCWRCGNHKFRHLALNVPGSLLVLAGSGCLPVARPCNAFALRTTVTTATRREPSVLVMVIVVLQYLIDQFTQ